MRSALEGAGIAFVAGGAVEAGSLGAFSGAGMTMDAYERQGVSRYAQLAAIVASILDAAIRAQPNLHAQPAQYRAKDPASLKAKLVKLEIAEGRDLTTAIKDLAGVRLVFYSNADVDRFLHSGIVRDNFDVDWSRTRLHYPGADPAQPDNQFIGNNYVVRLKPDRAALPEYAPVAGLWCEVQVQTILNHAWSAMAHDTIYKRPDLAGVGQAQMERINARMSKIMRQYLLPAGFEFQKVLADFDRLAEGKNLFDTDVLDQIVNAPDNNVRYDLIDAFDDNVLPLYDNITDVYPAIRDALLRAVAVARTTPEQPKETPYGSFMARTVKAITDRVLKIVMRLRYVDIEATFDALAELYLGAAAEEEREYVVKAAAEFAKHDLAVWRQHGAIVQIRLLDRIDTLDENHRALLRPLLTEIYRSALDPEVHGTTSTWNAVQISTGSVVASDALKIMRRRAIAALFAQYLAAATDVERRDIIAALNRATRMPIRGNYADALLVAVLDDTKTVVDFYASQASAQAHELRQAIEHDLLFLYHRNRGVPQEGEFAEAIAAARAALDAAILRYRDTVNAIADFVAFKTLVGYQSVFEPEWENSQLGWEAKEAYRETRIEDYVAGIDASNADHWFDIALSCASVKSNDLATFPSFGKFIRRVSELKPDIGEAWLEKAQGTPLARFMPGFLHGLAKSRPKLARKIASSAIAKGEFLAEVVLWLRHAEPLDGSLAKRGAGAAIKRDAADAVYTALEMAVARAPDLGAAEAREIFLSCLNYLDRTNNVHWTLTGSIWWEKNKFADALTDDDLRTVLKALVAVPEVDWHVETMLMDMSARVPSDVIALFGQRFAHENALREDPLSARYEALPFKLDRLAPHLAAHVELTLAQAAVWNAADPRLARFKSAAFMAKLHPQWSAGLENALWTLFETGDQTTREFVLAVLANYEGAAFMHPLLRNIVAALPEGDELLSDVSLALHETGVMHGEFGAVAAYRAKADALKAWLTDERARVRAFAEDTMRGYENHIAAEQRRAEEDLAMRRLAYDEPPVPPSEATEGEEQS
ncbi:relA/spoT [alpha proteobacterium U9-1i]|nr:relA/spoT [alpha proteobacterium U9-1i]